MKGHVGEGLAGEERRGEERLHATLGRATHDGLGWDGRNRPDGCCMLAQHESRRGRPREKAGQKLSVHARRGEEGRAGERRGGLGEGDDQNKKSKMGEG